jgi:hypothetical protein
LQSGEAGRKAHDPPTCQYSSSFLARCTAEIPFPPAILTRGTTTYSEKLADNFSVVQGTFATF